MIRIKRTCDALLARHCSLGVACTVAQKHRRARAYLHKSTPQQHTTAQQHSTTAQHSTAQHRSTAAQQHSSTAAQQSDITCTVVEIVDGLGAVYLVYAIKWVPGVVPTFF